MSVPLHHTQCVFSPGTRGLLARCPRTCFAGLAWIALPRCAVSLCMLCQAAFSMCLLNILCAAASPILSVLRRLQGACTFGPRLADEEIKALAEFVLSSAQSGWQKPQ